MFIVAELSLGRLREHQIEKDSRRTRSDREQNSPATADTGGPRKRSRFLKLSLSSYPGTQPVLARYNNGLRLTWQCWQGHGTWCPSWLPHEQNFPKRGMSAQWRKQCAWHRSRSPGQVWGRWGRGDVVTCTPQWGGPSPNRSDSGGSDKACNLSKNCVVPCVLTPLSEGHWTHI